MRIIYFVLILGLILCACATTNSSSNYRTNAPKRYTYTTIYSNVDSPNKIHQENFHLGEIVCYKFHGYGGETIKIEIREMNGEQVYSYDPYYIDEGQDYYKCFKFTVSGQYKLTTYMNGLLEDTKIVTIQK